MIAYQHPAANICARIALILVLAVCVFFTVWFAVPWAIEETGQTFESAFSSDQWRYNLHFDNLWAILLWSLATIVSPLIPLGILMFFVTVFCALVLIIVQVSAEVV